MTHPALYATVFNVFPGTLIERRGRIQERDRLLNDVWGYESIISTRTVDTHVRRLRKKLGNAGDVIESVRGFGYRLKEK
ncbi:MAG TPA: winged helix-turn-helix domain-containing protein [Candidatus Udaeobacter sp.]|nr:winged helix-turn-helix domain-containing protein [Candidatus Udaeobacter sp.]